LDRRLNPHAPRRYLNYSCSGVRKRVLNQAGASKGKQCIEQTQREFFRKRHKYEPLEQSEATIQDGIFEKLEASSIRRKKFDFDQIEPISLQKAPPLFNGCSQNRPVSPKPIASQPSNRKYGHPELLKSQSLPSSSMRMDETVQVAALAIQHPPKICNPSKLAVPTSISTLLKVEETKPIQKQRDSPLGKPIAYQKPTASQPSNRKYGHPELLKLQSLPSSSMRMDEPVQVASLAIQHPPKMCNPPKQNLKLAVPTSLSMPQDFKAKDATFLEAPASSNFIENVSKMKGNIIEVKISGGEKKPKTFIDASTQCASEQEVISLKLDNPHQKFGLQLLANYSQMPRSVQHLLSKFFSEQF
jgi:hypothetical protein